MTENEVQASKSDADSAENTDTPAETNPANTEPDPGDDEKKVQNAEAAKYRRQLRDAQSQLKTITAQLDAVQRQQVETLLAGSGVKAEAVFAVAEIADLLGDDGAIDPEKLAAAVTTATEKFGIVKAPKGNHVPGVGNQPSVLPPIDEWRGAFAPKRR